MIKIYVFIFILNLFINFYSAEPSAIQIPPAPDIVAALQTNGLGTLQQIPAVVVYDGPLRLIPYLSYRTTAADVRGYLGGVVELNIYGDPATPCAVELGLTRDPKTDPAAATESKARLALAAYLVGILNRPWADQTPPRIVRELSRRMSDTALEDGISVTAAGVLLDVTLPTASDAFGAWWIGISRPDVCDQQRATPTELEILAIACKPAQPVAASVPAPTVTIPTDTGWTALDGGPLRYQSARITTSPGTASGGSVYVRAYTRRDGTYVSGHSRKR